MQIKRCIGLWVLCLGILLAGCSTGAESKQTPTPLPQIVDTAQIVFTVKRGPLISEKDETGTLVPAVQDELFFRSSGYIARVLVKSGDTFKKGDVLAELQMDDLLDQLQQAQIDLEVSQTNLDNENLQKTYDVQKAQSDVVINQKQVDIAQHTLDTATYSQKVEAQLDLDIAQEKLKTAQAYLALIQGEVNSDTEKVVMRNQVTVDRLNRMIAERQLLAPYDGVVLYTNIKPGTQISAFSTAALVGDPSRLVVQIPYDFDLANTIDSNTNVSFSLTKSFDQSQQVEYKPGFLPVNTQNLGTNTQSSSSTPNYMYFSFPDGQNLQQAAVGTQVYLKVIIGNKSDVLMLPPPAIRGNDEFKYVIVLEGDYHRRVEVVSIGLKTTDEWEIIANLKEGDQVLGP